MDTAAKKMITVTRVDVIDEESYNQMFCQQCNSKIGFKLRDARVHVTRLTRRAGHKRDPFGLTCLRCKTSYLITTDDK